MTTIRLLCWNVNGIRAIHRKGFLEWFTQESPDILCLQETKAHPEQLPKKLMNVAGYTSHFASAQRKGYSGTALYTRITPHSVSSGLGIEEFDMEGRTIIADYGSFVLYNIYYPNGQSSPERLRYKMEFYDAFLKHADALQRKGCGLVICGDVNTAHTEIDLARPKENSDRSGFLPQERAWIDTLISHGFIDTFRLFTSEGGHYTWWDYKSKARERNVGWRIDYFFVSENLKSRVKSASIHADVMGSDHCPIELELEI